MATSWHQRSLQRLSAPLDTSSLAAFRVLFGATMAIACARFLAMGWLQSQLLEPQLLFPYPGLELLRPHPFMQLHMVVLIAAALCIALGLYTRVACLLFLLGFSYLELLDRCTYLNHYYLVSCLALLLAATPAGARCSLDVLRNPGKRVSHAPAFMLLALRLQVAVVYLFAGTAKLNADWLLEAQPLRIWLSAHSDLPLLGGLLARPETALVACWLGMLFDLSVVPLLSLRATRRFAFAALALFHLTTGLLLRIGMFPWIMLSAATLLLPADWPSRFVVRHAMPARVARAPGWLAALLAAHCALQLAVPLYRQLAYPDAAWSYQGFNFAWKVMIAEKAGHVRLRVRELDSGRTEELDGARLLTPLQARAVAADPALIADLARQVAARARTPVAVYVDAFASLNGRASARLVDPTSDVSLNTPARWILPPPD